MAAIKGEKTLADLAHRFNMHSKQITQWRGQLLDGAAGVLCARGEVGAGRARDRLEDAACEDWRAVAGGWFFVPRARQGLTSERKAMIARAYDLPLNRQAKVLGIRGSVYCLPLADPAMMHAIDVLYPPAC